MELNFLGTVSITKQVLPYMTQRGTGSIVTVSSVVGLAGVPLGTGYSASKHALQVMGIRIATAMVILLFVSICLLTINFSSVLNASQENCFCFVF